MESSRLLTCLDADYARLREVAARDLSAPVPSCPGWTVTDLVYHVAEVYLHKTEAMRRQAVPEPWPPDLTGEEPIAALERAYAALTAEFAARGADGPAYTFYEPEQTVGFWIRRMAQETVIHRVDAELALGEPVRPIPDDLAVDGVDEVLAIFLGYGSHRWPGQFAADLKDTTGGAVEVSTAGGRWLVTPAAGGIEVGASGAAPVEATVSGAPDPLLRWLWGRGGDGTVRMNGDADALARLRRLLVIATQ
jgi:uncharacterized protein (TIGR03083 family)